MRIIISKPGHVFCVFVVLLLLLLQREVQQLPSGAVIRQPGKNIIRKPYVPQ